ncbi:MAG: vanadium-dependent haloperoxidase [Chloroflexi bacterium]|nr:MAG: vanadium-dependent haloperoxidase [Chloroflexota bacterium]
MEASVHVPRVLRLGATLALAALLVLLPAVPSAAALASPSGSRPGPGLQWYDITAQAVQAAALPEPITQSRVWAVSWLAADRALHDGSGQPFTAAAFVTALHDTLVALVPTQRTHLDGALASSLAGVPGGRAKDRGIAAGRREAAAVLAQRSGDGLDTASIDVPFTPPPAAPGVWQPTPPSFGPAVRAGQPRARSFLLRGNDQFRPGPPPGLDSTTYLDDLAEVRAIGANDSPARTPAQTDTALFWEPNSIDEYVQVLRAILTDPDHPLGWQARLVAAFHVITIDAQIAIYDAKYAYLFWRPVTAIRTGAVAPDPAWTPLFSTPRHPEYPSGHGGYAGAAQEALQALVGPRPDDPISVTSATDPGSVHTYRAWSTITQENVDARVWEGIHFRNSDLTGVRVGREVAVNDLRLLGAIGL